MARNSFTCTGLLLCLGVSSLLLLVIENQSVNAFATLDSQKDDTPNRDTTTTLRLKSNSRSGFAFAPRMVQIPPRSKIPLELDLLLDADNELMEKTKRYDDYGHSRFGKRAGNGDQFDDYGHMRFGRSTSG